MPPDGAAYHANRFSAGARAYADVWAPVLLPHGRRLLAELRLASAQRVLEIGAGVGSLLPEIRSAAPRARVVGVDIAPGMLALAPPGYDLAVMDAARLALGDSTFDAAVMAFVIFFLRDPLAALVEARRVLRPGGALALASWQSEAHFPAQDLWLAAIRARGATRTAWSESVLGEEPLRRTLEHAGFADVRTSRARLNHRHDPQRFLELRMAMATPWLATLSTEDRAALHACVRDGLGALAPDDFVDPAEMVFATARSPRADSGPAGAHP